MNLRYRVELSQAERHELKALLSAGKHAVRKRKARTNGPSLSLKSRYPPIQTQRVIISVQG
jgi:hypothetical protein